MELLANLLQPAKFSIVDALPDKIHIDDLEFSGGFSPWPLSSDILLDATDGTWLGIANIVDIGNSTGLEAEVRTLDPNCVCYKDLSVQCDAEFYGVDSSASHILEIVWKKTSTIEFLPAMLTEVVWYSANDHIGVKPRLAGVGIRHLPDVLQEFGLKLPKF
ncbi:MAG: hypothetical protein GY758_07980 [Fuerstiella sp.]|nr:hypothetical protein [Fuerstiella sp.]